MTYTMDLLTALSRYVIDNSTSTEVAEAQAWARVQGEFLLYVTLPGSRGVLCLDTSKHEVRGEDPSGTFTAARLLAMVKGFEASLPTPA